MSLERYYNLFDPQRGEAELMFRAGDGLQSRELNELQSVLQHRISGIANAIFKDGDLIRDAQLIVDTEQARVRAQAGAIYVRGAVWGVPPAEIAIALTGTVVIGVRLSEAIVTELDDPRLRDPAVGTRNYQEPGAARRQVQLRWARADEDLPGDFFPVHTLIDGVVQQKAPPPQLDAVTQAIARYDRDNAGGSYVVSGLSVAVAPSVPPSVLPSAGDSSEAEQVFTVAEGRARVNGFAIDKPASSRITYRTAPDLARIDAEPHLSTTAALQRITLDRVPLSDIEHVRITAERTVTLTHGSFSGSQDPLPDSAVLELVEVRQGTTVFQAGADYRLTAGRVDWSPGGAEPAPGSTYSVRYRHLTSATASAIDETGFSVEGAVAGSLVLVSYRYKMPRFDRLCLDAEGQFIWLQGVAADYGAQPPAVPAGLLCLASVHQSWRGAPRVIQDAVRVVPMAVLADIEQRLDRLTVLAAQQRLAADIQLREASAKKGLFTDPFLDDSQRDAGVVQDAAIVAGVLTLPIHAQVHRLGQTLQAPQALPHQLQAELTQAARTGAMPINPYLAFAPVPASVTLQPAVDRWTVTQTNWASAVTQRFVVGSGDMSRTASQTVTRLAAQSESAIETLRPIEVRVTARGFGPGEALASLTFDGIEVDAQPDPQPL